MLLSFGSGLERRMTERAQGMGKGVVVLWPGTTARSWRGVPEGRSVILERGDVDALLRDVPTLSNASPEMLRREVIGRGERVYRAMIAGVTPPYGELRSMTPEPGGRFLSWRDEREARAVAFLGDRIARELFPGDSAVGRRVVLAGAPFTVVGVLAPKAQDSDYGGTDDERVCIPATTFERRFGVRALDDVVLGVDDPGAAAGVIEDATVALARRRGFDAADEGALDWWDTTEGDRIRAWAFLAMDVMTGGAGVLTLLVGGLGIAQLMFLVVRQRTAEIGLYLALGARPRRVMTRFVTEALALTGLGGLIGIAAALGLGRLIGASSVAEDVGTPHVSPALALGTAALIALVGVAAGWFPARRAARLDPVRALAEG